MTETERGEVKVLAHSPGQYPILVVETAGGDLRALYFEMGYDPAMGKPVQRDWLEENAIGRHSFVAVDPPREVETASLGDFVRGEILTGR